MSNVPLTYVDFVVLWNISSHWPRQICSHVVDQVNPIHSLQSKLRATTRQQFWKNPIRTVNKWGPQWRRHMRSNKQSFLIWLVGKTLELFQKDWLHGEEILKREQNEKVITIKAGQVNQKRRKGSQRQEVGETHARKEAFKQNGTQTAKKSKNQTHGNCYKHESQKIEKDKSKIPQANISEVQKFPQRCEYKLKLCVRAQHRRGLLGANLPANVHTATC